MCHFVCLVVKFESALVELAHQMAFLIAVAQQESIKYIDFPDGFNIPKHHKKMSFPTNALRSLALIFKNSTNTFSSWKCVRKCKVNPPILFIHIQSVPIDLLGFCCPVVSRYPDFYLNSLHGSDYAFHLRSSFIFFFLRYFSHLNLHFLSKAFSINYPYCQMHYKQIQHENDKELITYKIKI